MSELFDDSLLSDFVAESREHLDSIEPDMLAMEQEGANVSEEIINRIFRAIHSIKGGAGFLAFESLKNLSHIMESVLMQVRDGELTITPEITDVLLSGVDKLRAMLDDIQESENVACAEEIEHLTKIVGGDMKAEPAGEPKAVEGSSGTASADSILAEFGVPMEHARKSAAHGRHLFVARVLLYRDVKSNHKTVKQFMDNMNTVGEFIASTVETEEAERLDVDSENDVTISFLFSSVLESTLAGTAIGVPDEQVQEIVFDEAEAGAVAPEEPAVGEGEPDEAKSATPEKASSQGNGEVAETLRVKVSSLTRLMNMAGELVLARNQLLRNVADQTNGSGVNPAILQNIDHVTTEIQEGIMQTRMQPVGTIFGRFPRVVRDLSRQLGKEIDLKVTGSEVELDKSIIELLGDPLTHIIRNCCDHAMETPEAREAAGKPRRGTVNLDAFHESGQVNISIRDDGAGIDSEKIAALAIEKGVIKAEQAEKMTPRDKVNLIFAPGFSTVEVVSEVSGRGVGMDVVRSNIEKLGGTVIVDSVLGEGTSVVLQLPLTLAIIPSLIVGVSDQRYAIPQVNVDEFVWVRASEVHERIERLQGEDVLRLRGMLLPLVRLSDVLGLPRTVEGREDRRERLADRRSDDDSVPEREEAGQESKPDRTDERRKDWRGDYNIVVVKLGANQFGIVVDKLFDTEEIVVKPLASFIKQVKAFSGATILGDGRVITILDIAGVGALTGLRFADIEAEERKRQEEETRRAADAAQARRSVILFTSAESEYFAVPQENVLRLESIKFSDIQRVGDKELIQYRGHGLPIIRLDHHLPVRPMPEDATEAFLIIPKVERNQAIGEAPAGIMASRIIDALDVEVELQESDITGPGVIGSAIVQDQITIFVSLDELIESITG